MEPDEPLYSLLHGRPVSLAGWFADPLRPQEAETLLAEARAALKQAATNAGTRYRLQLLELIAAFWCGREVQAACANLLAVATDDAQRALLELCYGQLLKAVRLQGADARLDAGFRRAAHLLEPDDYFLVLKRHELLRALPGSARRSVAAPLEQLLSEARVIRRLRGPDIHPRRRESRHTDTLD